MVPSEADGHPTSDNGERENYIDEFDQLFEGEDANE